MKPVHIGLIGDYDAAVIAHQAIPRALQLAARDASEPEQADPEHWRALSEGAAKVLDAEERLWAALYSGSGANSV